MALVGFAAQAQTQTNQGSVETVVVTGTMIQGNVNLTSPVTLITPQELDQRGISTVQDALQQTLVNNGPAVNNNWSGGDYNFALGASGISLRGLSTNSTVVLFDGMRSAYYPLADDGVRNFVDVNTIPDDIVNNIQVLRDGASAEYGADAIAGVINIVTKKQFNGISARAEGGLSSRGDAAEWKAGLTAGTGDLDADHVNVYISASYDHTDILHAAERPYPFNSYDWSNVCSPGKQAACAEYNNTINGIQADGTYGGISTAGEFAVRPYNYNPATQQITTAVAGSAYQNLDGCAAGTPITLTAAQKAANPTSPSTVCNYDYQKLYADILPSITRVGLSGHVAFDLPSGIEGSLEANFMQDSVFETTNIPSRIYGNAPAGIYFPNYSTSSASVPPFAPGSHLLFLPIYVCPERQNCDTAADHTLNPNDPFASQGYAARLIGRDWYAPIPTTDTRDRTYRVAGNFDGPIFGDGRWDLDVTASHIDFLETNTGYVYIQHLLDVINDGTFNFVDPTKNNTPLAALGGLTANQYLMPKNYLNASSDESEARFTITKPVYTLPGGDLTVVVGGEVRYEAIDDPSGNSDIGGPTQRFFTLNAFGTVGSRNVYAGFFEINAPVLTNLTVDASGRFDDYSTGQSNFSPKIGVNYKPLDWITLKGSYSQGFRIPSFAEANALPTTGYVTNQAVLFNDTYLAQYNCTVATFSSCPIYIKGGSYGLTTIASPHLKPENSRSWVFDLSVQPTDEVTLTTTYYNIKKTGAIAQLDCGAALQDYYASQALPTGCTIVADSPDPNFPNAKPRVAFLYAPFVNANAVKTSGFDFGATYNGSLTPVEDFVGVTDAIGAVHVISALQATWIKDLETDFPDGHKERYDGTLGNYNLTSGSGTPNWKGSWQTTFDDGIYEFTSTLNWISGYNVSAQDQGTGYRDCGLSDGTRPCRTADYFTWDVNTQVQATDNIKVYFTVNNVLDNMPPIDTIATYGLTGYNEVVGGNGILGRYFKLGIRLDY